MSHFNAYRTNLPPGCTDADGGASDTYVCSHCDETIEEGEIDEGSEAFEPVCEKCARLARREDDDDL